jgi:hypothetical protein
MACSGDSFTFFYLYVNERRDEKNEDGRNTFEQETEWRIINLREKLAITGINTMVKSLSTKWLHQLERMPENRIPKLLYQYKPKAEGARDAQQK